MAGREQHLLSDVCKRAKIACAYRSIDALSICVEVNDVFLTKLQHARTLCELLRKWRRHFAPRTKRTISKRHSQIHSRPRVVFEHKHVLFLIGHNCAVDHAKARIEEELRRRKR